PDSLGPILCGNEPVALVDGLVGLQLFDESLDRLSYAVGALSPVFQGRNILDRIPGKPRPPPAHLQNPAFFIMDNERDWRFNDCPVEEPDDFALGTRTL